MFLNKLLNDDDALELCRVTLLSRQMENTTFFWNAARNMELPESMFKDGTDTLTEWQTLRCDAATESSDPRAAAH